MRIDFLTVTYREELPLLALQARSMRIHLDDACVGRIVIVVNERPSSGSVKAIRKTILPEYGALGEFVEVLSAGDLIPPAEQAKSGWRSQQTIKLVSARYLSADHYVALDSKSHFIRPVNASSFVTRRGLMVSTRRETHGPRQHRLQTAREYFGLPRESRDDLLPITTPFVLSRRDVQEMMELVEHREGVSFSWFFRSCGPAYTEFFMIYAYSLLRHGSIGAVYEIGPPFSVTLWEKKPRGAKLEEVLDDVRETKTFHSLALHIRRARILNDQDARLLASAWVHHGLFPEMRDALRFLARLRTNRAQARVQVAVQKLFPATVRGR